ncbi:uncharacterized protein LOC131223254 [Magnolia sinica]|uniref:uncharacterized protein LOC131223254 n=1 Tax=Magnolia sinica TaxID=86752 RepID=UPI00265A6608|nr:uncharacterized protein LOC131223254 [Magnolia sinica]
MATILSFRPTGIRPNASSDHRKPDTQRRKSSSASWWTPLFGWPSDPDYIDGTATVEPQNVLDLDPEATRVRSRFSPGCFTEEKAKQLRKKTMETATFHDIMYHSAIASRLASDLPDRSSGR